MESDANESANGKQSNHDIKVNRSMCTVLRDVLDKVTWILPAIESARPSSRVGIQELCSINNHVEKGKLVIRHCTESSKLFLAITAEATLLRCRRITSSLSQSLCIIQTMVQPLLATKIVEIIDHINDANFSIDPSDEEARKSILELLQQADSPEELEFSTFQFVASKLSLTTPKSILIERRAIKKLLQKVNSENKKRGVLIYLLNLVEKYGKSAQPWSVKYKTLMKQSVASLIDETISKADFTDETISEADFTDETISEAGFTDETISGFTDETISGFTDETISGFTDETISGFTYGIAVLIDGPESVNSFFDTIYNLRLRHASPFTLITSLHLSGLSDFVELPGLPVLHTWRISGCERLNAVSICEKLSAVEAFEISCCPELTSLTGLNKLLSLRSLSLSFCFNLQFDLHVQLPPLLEYLDLTYCPSLEEWCKNAGLQNWVLDETIESFQRCSPVGDSPVYGRENEKNSILEFLLSDDFNRSNLTVVCIVGESGIGKTSIVQLIYSEERVLDSFDARMFITMPEKSDETRLIKKLIESVTSSPCTMTEADLLEELLIDELSGTKIFVVLDDAENENPCFWNRIVTILNHSNRGSVLMVTTKSKDVAEVIGAMQTYYLDPLSDYYCWKIFWQRVFTGLNTNANTDLVETGKQLVSKCQHNPLCIKVLTGLLVCLKNEESWVEILKTDLWNMDGFDGDTLPALRVGYELLPNDLKKCLQYCSLFPKDYVFAKQQIVRMWMSQGFIISVEGRQPEEVGIQNFDELLLRGFFQHSPLHDVQEDKYIMHDLIRALAAHFSRNECSPAEDALERTLENCFHFSLNPSKIQMDKMEPLIKEASDLQSFLALSSFSLQARINISILDITSLSDLFTKCMYLRTLDLSCTDIVELPSSVGMLKQLRYLGVNDTKIRSIPRALCSLVSLQTLEAKDCQHLVELPESMMELTNLRHLDVSKKLGFVKMMIGFGQLTNLQSLASFCVGCEIPYCSIRELKDLNCLSGCLQIAGLENIRNGLDAKEAALHNKVHLNALCLHWKDNRTCTESEESVTMSEEVLNNLKPNPKIGELIIRNYRGNLFPTWMGDPSFSKLVSIILDKCLNCSQFPALGGLPSLRHLSVQKLYHLVRLENTDNQFVSKNTPKFPSLETLNLWEMYDLEELFETSDRDFPCLRTLSISRCPMLKRVPCFSSLLNLSLYCCVKLPYLPDFPSLESLSIDGFQTMKSLELPKDLPALKKLEIRHCNMLLLVEGLPELSLEKLNVVHCPKFDSPKGWKLCHPEPIRTTRWFFPKEGSTTQMEHEETSEPSGEDTIDKQPKADKKPKVDKSNFFLKSCISALILFFWFWSTPQMLGDFLTKLLTLLFIYAFPAFKCFQILEQRPGHIEQLRFWCQYWIIVAIVMIVETVGVFVQWIPAYGELKLAFFVYLWYSKTKGTDVVYDTFLRLHVMQRLSYLRANAGKIIVFYTKNFADKGVTVFLEALNYVVSQTNKAIKKRGFFSFRKKKEEEPPNVSELILQEKRGGNDNFAREKIEEAGRQRRPHQSRYDQERPYISRKIYLWKK